MWSWPCTAPSNSGGARERRKEGGAAPHDLRPPPGVFFAKMKQGADENAGAAMRLRGNAMNFPAAAFSSPGAAVSQGGIGAVEWCEGGTQA